MATVPSTKTEQRAATELPPIVADTLPKLLRRGYEQWPQRVGMRQKRLGVWQRYSWSAVYENVRTFALGLASLGLRAGETVAIVGENEPQLFWAELAAQSLGGKVVCLYPDMTPAEMQYIIDNAEATFLVAEDQEQVDKALEIHEKLPLLRKVVYWDARGMWQYHQSILASFKEIQDRGRQFGDAHPGYFETAIDSGLGDDVAILSYTSGTTGLPKGVIITHSMLLDVVYRLTAAMPIKPFSQHLSYISPAWATEQYFGLTLGLFVPLVVNFPEEPETVQENIREVGAQLLVLGPRQWESLASLVQARMLDASRLRQTAFNLAMAVGRRMSAGRLDGTPVGLLWRLLYPLANLLVLRPVRDRLGLAKTYFAVSGGSAMAPDVFRFFHAVGVRLRNIYGMTEMGLFTMHQGDRFDLETVGSWYQSHPHFGLPLEWQISAEGELLVRGGAGFSGYFKKPEATAEKLLDGWFRTGDAVAMTDRGELVYLERVSDMRELATGHRFPPQYIETRLRFSPFIKDAMTLGDKEKPFVAALINIDAETCGRWAEQRQIAYSTFPELSQKAEIRELIKGEIAKVNRVLPEESRIRRFANLPKELDPDEAELTRTRKLRREFLEARFKDLIAAIYDGRQALDAEVAVKYRDGRTSTVRMGTAINDVEQGTGGKR